MFVNLLAEQTKNFGRVFLQDLIRRRWTLQVCLRI